MRRMAEDMDRLFDSFGLGTGLGVRSGGYDDLWSAAPFGGAGALWSPQVEVFERDNKLVVRADVPGVNKDDVNVEINDDVLTISGERKDEHEEKREGFYRSERSYGQFYRTILLPEGVNPDQSEATFKDGVLEVTFDKPQEQQRKGRKIQVR
jgi:HSP20 family protein